MFYAIFHNNDIIMTTSRKENTKEEVTQKYLDFESTNCQTGFKRNSNFQNGDRITLAKCEKSGRTDLKAFTVRSEDQVALNAYNWEISSLTQKVKIAKGAEAAFNMSLAKDGPLFAMTYYGRSLAQAQGYSSVFSRILNSMDDESLQALDFDSKLGVAKAALAELLGQKKCIQEYFLSGILRSSSAHSSNPLSNLFDDAQRDGILEALRELSVGC